MKLRTRSASKSSGKKWFFFDCLDSTNNYAKRIAAEDAEEGTVIVADSQSGGRGRLGRKWASPPGTGIYMSVILKPVLPPEEVQIITLAASVAVVSAFDRLAGIRAGIKWPNDVLLDGKKVCGILTEMNSEMERVNFIVLGIGVNFSSGQEEFPPEFAGRATSLQAYADQCGIDMKGAGRLEIIRAVLKELDGIYRLVLKKKHKEIIQKWKEYAVTIGRDVRIISGETEYAAFAEDVTEDGKLVVRCDDGSVRLVQSGEVSIHSIS